ncbi:MAG: class I SAM-dependent methyltransferase [Bacteroidales bacterium]
MDIQDTFDQYASDYDSWFIENSGVLETEANLVAYFLKNPGDTLSVGCGSGLFESVLRKKYDIDIRYGIEPAHGMAEIARKRGMTVEEVTAEEADYGENKYDTIMFNGTPCYIVDLQSVLKNVYKALKPGGKVVIIDIPKESGYGTLYNLAKTLGSWDHPLLKDVHPQDPYPMEFVNVMHCRTTDEKVDMLKNAGFQDFEYAQTLTRHPLYSNGDVEETIPGYDKGDYVAIKAIKKS